MNLKYYYWYYKEVLPKWFCNALIKDTIENKKIDTGLISPSNKGLKNLKIRVFRHLENLYFSTIVV